MTTSTLIFTSTSTSASFQVATPPGPDAISVLSTVLLVVGVVALLLTAVAAVWEAWYAHKIRQQCQVAARKRRIAQDAAALHSVLAAQAFRVHQEMVREAVRRQRW